MNNKPSYEELLKKVEYLEKKIETCRSFMDNSPDLFYRTDLEGRILFISSSVYGLSGYTAEEAVGMRMAEDVYLFPEERKAFMARLKEEGRVANFEARLKRKDGSIWWASTSAHFYRDQEGNILGVESITRDISERKAVEESLLAVEERFRIAFHTSPDSITISRVSDGRYIDVNQGFTDLTGYSREYAVEKTSLEINIWKDPADREHFLDALKKEGVVKNLEARFVRKNGEIGVGLMSARTLVYNDENIILTVTRDITARKSAEAALQKSEQQLRLITENMVDVISRTDEHINIIYASASTERVFGYRPQELAGKSALDFIHPDDKESLLQQSAEARGRQASSVLLKYRWRHADGSYLWAESTARLLYDDEGQSKGAVFGTRSINDRVQAEKESASLEKKLIQAQKLEAVGRLAGGIAHDMNNLLSPILGYSEMLLLGADANDSRKKYLEQILKAGKGARDLVRQLLAFSRRQPLEYKPVDVNETLTGFEKLLRRTIRENIEIDIIRSPMFSLSWPISARLSRLL